MQILTLSLNCEEDKKNELPSNLQEFNISEQIK